MPCPNCSADPITDDERIISLFLSDHYHNEKSLNALHVQITSGSKNYVIPNEIREQLKPILNQFSEEDNKKEIKTKFEVKEINSYRVSFLKKIIIFLLLSFIPASVGTVALLVFGQIILLTEKLVPFINYFDDLNYLIQDFIGGVIYSYFLFWSGTKIANRLFINTTLFLCTLILISSYFTQLNFSIVKLNDPSLATVLGSLLITISCWSNNKFLRFLKPKNIMMKRISESIERFKNKVSSEFIKDFCLETKSKEDKKEFYEIVNIYERKEYDNALIRAEEIYRKNTSLVGICLIIGHIKYFKGDLNGSIKALNTFLNSDLCFKNDFLKQAYYLRAKINYKNEDFSSALQDFSSSLNFDRNALKTMQQVALTKIKLKQFNASIRDIDEFLKKYPNDLYLLELKGVANIKLQKYKLSIEIFEKLLNDLPSTNKQNAKYNLYLAKIYYYEFKEIEFDHRLMLANTYILDALELDPENKEIYNLFQKIIKDINDQ